jgi:hypothetical protein
MATGLVIIGGSVVGGIALASNQDETPPPSATVPSTTPRPTGSTDDDGSPSADNSADDSANGSTNESAHDDATVKPNHATPSPTASRHDDDPTEHPSDD